MVQNGLIYDVGAHKGEDTDFYLKKGFRVVAVEAFPDFCLELAQKFRDPVASGQLTIVNAAITAGATSSVDFFLDSDVSVWGTVNPDWVARNRALGRGRTRTVSVAAHSLFQIMQSHGVPRYCKIDIEGSDREAIRSLLGSSGELPPFISIESEKRDWDRLMEELLLFRDLGYSRFKIIDQTLVRFQSCPAPPREGGACQHAFCDGSSGLFGDELPGVWLSFSEVVEAYRRIFVGYALNGDNGMFRGGKGIFSFFRLAGAAQGKIARLRVKGDYRNPAYILPPAAWYDTHAAR